MKKILFILLFPLLGIGQNCEFIPMYLGKDIESSYGTVDSMDFRIYHGGRVVFETHKFMQSYNFADFSNHMNLRSESSGQVDVGITQRSRVFIQIKFGNVDCLIRRAVTYLKDKKNITPYNPFFPNKKPKLNGEKPILYSPYEKQND